MNRDKDVELVINLLNEKYEEMERIQAIQNLLNKYNKLVIEHNQLQYRYNKLSYVDPYLNVDKKLLKHK